MKSRACAARWRQRTLQFGHIQSKHVDNALRRQHSHGMALERGPWSRQFCFDSKIATHLFIMFQLMLIGRVASMTVFTFVTCTVVDAAARATAHNPHATTASLHACTCITIHMRSRASRQSKTMYFFREAKSTCRFKISRRQIRQTRERVHRHPFSPFPRTMQPGVGIMA